VDIIFTRAIDMNLDPPFLYIPLNKKEENNLVCYSETVEFYTTLKKKHLIYQPKGVGWQKTLFTTYLKNIRLPKIGLRRFPLMTASKLEVLIKIKSSSGTRIINSSQRISF
jgi:hypothetical protein